MNLFKRSVELVVIRDIFNPQNNIETYQGQDIEQLLRQAFGNQGLSESVRLYHGNLLDEVTPKTPQDVDKVMRLNGRIYAVVKPMGLDPFTIALIVSVVVSVATAFLMPVPNIPSNSSNQPPSPNNALAARTNKQRLGGRIPDIYGTVWSVPDLIAQTYSVYIDNREVEFSYMCVGRGRFDVTQALDDATPINQVPGSGVLIYNPDKSLDDEPDFRFGSSFTQDEASHSRLVTKRYTSVNGQILPPTDEYNILRGVRFIAPNKIDFINNSMSNRFKAGAEINIEQAIDMSSENGSLDEMGDPMLYSLSGRYNIASVAGKVLTLSSPELVSPDWQKLANNNDSAVAQTIAASVEVDTLWQGWFYTNDKDHDKAIINLVARQGLYITGKGRYQPIGINIQIESEVVDINNNAVSGTLELQVVVFYGSAYKKYASNNGWGSFRYGNHWWSQVETPNEDAAASAAMTIEIKNSHMATGKRLRFRIRRQNKRVDFEDTYAVQQEIRIADFYGARLMTALDAPKGITTVYTKTLATEGALSLKERKLRLLVQRYVTDATSGILKLSNRADDIIRHIATDPKIGDLQLTQIDIAQIKNEVDALIAYFGTPLCAEFCGTFDDNNLSSEETIQTVAKAVFGQAKRQGNKIMLDFERLVPGSVAIFNSHNILPDTFALTESLGISNDYDGVTVEYTDPVDDAVVTLSYPNESLINPHEDKLMGVRNKEQAHMHMMRLYNKDRHAYKSCEFTAGDESNIVVRTNRVTVADQLRANVQQGSVDSIKTVGSDIVLHTTDPVVIDSSVPHTLFIQTINNGVESIAVTARDDYSVKLARLPSGEISSGYDSVVQATYQIVTEQDIDRDAYLVSQKDPSEGMTNKLTCTNYDDRYYQNDKDYLNGLIA